MPVPAERLHSLARRSRANRKGMDAVHEQIGQRGVDGALPRHARKTRKSRRGHVHRKVAFSARIMPGMTTMHFTVVSHDEPFRGQGSR